MIVSGRGTKDSPIVLDDDSESEVVEELIGTPSLYLAPPEDSELTPRLSPRPGTLLSNVARLNLSKSSAQNLEKYRRDLRQHTHGRKRKRAPTPSQVNGGSCLARGQPDPSNIVVDVVADRVKEEARHQLQNPPETLSQSRIGPPAKKAKHTHKPNDERIALPDRSPLVDLKESTTSKASNPLGPTPCPNAPWPIPQHSQFSDSTIVPSYSFDVTSLPLPVTAQDLFTGQLMSMTQEPFPVMNMDCDPMFCAMTMSVNGFAMSSTPIPSIGIPLPPKPTISEKQQSKLQPPPSTSTVKSESKHQLVSSKTSTKLEGANSEHLPARPPHSNDKFSISRQRAFTLHPTDRLMTASPYLPIGKPDFRDIHGVFPIIPSLMFPAPFGTASASYTPGLDRTLVLENLPKSCSSSKVWIQNWCLKACGSLPELFLVGPRRALVVFKQPDHAIDAWASPKLGVDKSGFRIVGAVGGSKVRQDVITAYWYRPGVMQERQLMISWTSSKKMVTEIKEMLAIPMDESAVAKILTEQVDEMLELCQVQQQAKTAESKLELQKMADQMGFHEKLAEVIEKAFIEEDVLKWEQKEIALIERERRLKSLPRYRSRHSGVGEVGGEEERKTEGNENILRPMNTQSIPVFASHQKQRNAPSSSTGGAVLAGVVAGPASVSGLSSAPTSLPAKPNSLPEPQLPLFSCTSRIIPPEKPELRFGQTAWKNPEFTISSSSKSQQTRIHPNHPALVNQSEQRTSNSSASVTVGTSTKHPPALPPSFLPSTLPAEPSWPDMPSCDVTTLSLSSPGKTELCFGQTAWNLPTIYPTISSSTKGKLLQDSVSISPTSPILDNRKEVAESQEQSQTVSSDVPLCNSIPVGVDESPIVTMATTSKPQANETSLTSNLPITAARISPKAVGSFGPVKLQLPMVSSSVSAATSESTSILKPGKAVASTSTGTSASSSLASTPVTTVASDFGEGTSDRVQMSDTITDQRVAVTVKSPAALTPPLTLVSAPRSPPVIPLKLLQELKRVLAKSTKERQNFLDNEFKATRLLMDQMMTITCKKERKQVTDLWKQKIRIIDEVTRSIRNDAKVWYSQEMKTWIRMRWPNCLDTSGILVIDDED